MIRPAPMLALAFAALLLAGCGGQPEAGADAEDAAATSESPEPVPAYVGVWAFDEVWCTDQTDGFPITITQTQFQGRENICDFDTVTQTPEGGWVAELVCQGEGQTTQERIALTPVADQLAITYLDREGTEPTLFSRCE